MTKHIFVVLMMVVSFASIQAQDLRSMRILERRTVGVFSTNEWDKALREVRAFWGGYYSSRSNLSADQIRAVYAASEQRHNCVYVGTIWLPGKLFYDASKRMEFTNSWHAASGKSCIILPSEKLIEKGTAQPVSLLDIYTGSAPSRGSHSAGYDRVFNNAAVSTFPQKIDATGRVVWIATNGRRDIEELEWVDAEIERVLDNERTKWAVARGMTLEEAKERYAKWLEIEAINTRLRTIGAIEKREATQDELLVIKEELMRLREAKTILEKK